MPESILAANTGDQAASREHDRLGFEPYVTAMAKFLTNPVTQGPLTISIEGEWGSGKSSFMLQLRERLVELAADESKPWTMPLTIEFNAWRHDKAEALWAAFAVEFTRRAKSEISIWKRLRGGVLLVLYRYKWKDGWLDFVRAVVMWAAIVVGAAWALFHGWILLDGERFETLGKLGLIGSALAAFLKGIATLVHHIGNPLEVDLSKFVKMPDYEKSISFIEQFHEDFSKIVKAYAGTRTVYVFIDDLDRCEVPKAAELMQALNLMMSSDQKRMVFILGMDRPKVAAGLAVKHKNVLPYLRAADPHKEQIGTAETYGLQFGFNFVEKFIQIPFVVPEPTAVCVEAYLTSLAKPPVAVRRKKKPVFDWMFRWVNGELRHLWREIQYERQQAQREAASQPVPDAPLPPTPRDPLGLTEDSKTFRDIAQLLAAKLRNNPRRIKQFVNLFRLRMFIAEETGLFDDGKITPELLGKFVALQLQYPLLIAELEAEPGILAVINDVRSNNSIPAAEYWKARPDVVALVKCGSGFSMVDDATIRKLLTVSPRVRTIDPNAPPQEEKSGPSAPDEALATQPLDVYLSGYSPEVLKLIGDLRDHGIKAWAGRPGSLAKYPRPPAPILAFCVGDGADIDTGRRFSMHGISVAFDNPQDLIPRGERRFVMPDEFESLVAYLHERRPSGSQRVSPTSIPSQQHI